MVRHDMTVIMVALLFEAVRLYGWELNHILLLRHSALATRA